MNFQNLDFEYVEPYTLPSQNHRRHVSSITPPSTASHHTLGHPRRGGTASPSDTLPSPSPQPTVIPAAPTPPSPPSESGSGKDIDGLERLFGHLRRAEIENAHRVTRPMTSPSSARTTPGPSRVVRFEEPDIPRAAMLNPAMAQDFKDDLARAASMVTPGIDDGPYIVYALDAMTRGGEASQPHQQQQHQHQRQRQQQRHVSIEGAGPFPGIHHMVPNSTPGLFQQRPRTSPAPTLSPPQPAHFAAWGPGRRVSSSPLREETVGDDDFAPLPEFHRSSSMTSFEARAWNLAGLTGPSLSSSVIESYRQPGYIPTPEPIREPPPEQYEVPPQATLHTSPMRFPRDVKHWQAQPNGPHSDVEDARRSVPLTYKPWILREPSLVLLMLMCLLMIVALIFSAVYSSSRHGLTAYTYTIYGGDYFVFRVLPQLLGAVVLIYAQCVMTAIFRILPFSMMASDYVRDRRNAVFLPLYPKTFLWPQLVGSWNIWVPSLNVWLLNFTIPLQSSLFTVIMSDGHWKWATNQGIAWTLVAFYVSMLASLFLVFAFWWRRATGMLQSWDLRSLADIVFLVSQSNSSRQYHGTETEDKRRSIRDWLDDNVEKLGCWFSSDAPELGRWYGIGVPNSEEQMATEKMGGQMWSRLRTNSATPSERNSLYDLSKPRRYLPWCFRNSQIILFVVASTILLIAMVAVSFADPTDVRYGFLPKLNAAPNSAGFSPADFLYAFLPSLLGMILFLGFQSLDLTLRILTPWGELSNPDGSRAETSLLVDYAACLPFESTLKAIKNRHWRVAAVSFLAPLFVLLPVLAGGIFMALTPFTGEVRMYPNIPAFSIVLALLFLYVFGLASLLPRRERFRLPHAVTCLAEVISFCCNNEIRGDRAFNYPRSPEELRARLDAGQPKSQQSLWTFSRGRHNDERLGIKRHSKYTTNPRSPLKYDRSPKGDRFSLPPSSRGPSRQYRPAVEPLDMW